jgi:hypothetical protein
MPRDTPHRLARLPLVTKTDLMPIAERLARMETLILEMRFEQDAGLKRLAKLTRQVDAIAEGVGNAQARRLKVRR